MAAVLERLEALAQLVAGTDDPVATCATLLAAADAGRADEIVSVLSGGDLSLVLPALRHGGILDEQDAITQHARDQLLRLEGIVSLEAGERDRWGPVMTVPAFLRRSLPEGRLSETLPALRQLVSSAGERLVMASPFLDSGFQNLIPAIVRFAGAGGEFLLITRELVDPASHNSEVVRELRNRCAGSRPPDVVSWEEEGLGLHMKAAVADSRRAYVGSANFTWGGMGSHAELGVLLEGPSVREIDRLLDVLADELRSRRRLQAR